MRSESTFNYILLKITCSVIRESVDSLCRDGTDTPIVRVHRKAFLTRESSRSKPFWAPSYSIPALLLYYCTKKEYKKVIKTFSKNVEGCRDGSAKNHRN